METVAPLTTSDDEPSTIPDRFIMQTPRPRMLEILLKALLRREPVVIGPTQFRFCKRGEQFDDGDYVYQALNTGLYERFGVWLNKTPLDGPPHHYKWMYVGDLGTYEEILTRVLDGLTAFDRESAIMNITFKHVIPEMRQNHAENKMPTAVIINLSRWLRLGRFSKRPVGPIAQESRPAKPPAFCGRTNGSAQHKGPPVQLRVY